MRAGTVQPVSDAPTVALMFPWGFLFCDLCISLFALVFLGCCVAIVVGAECILCSDWWCCFLCADFVVVCVICWRL